MNKITLLLLLITMGAYSQNKCTIVCHNGTVVKALNENSLKGHLKHGDIFLGDCTDDLEIGSECQVLALPKVDFSKPLPIGVDYSFYDVSGRLIQKGVVDIDLFEKVPKNRFILILIDGYSVTKIYLK